MKKVAKLVTVSFITRVVVDEDATNEEILETAKPNYIEKLNNNELLDNLDRIEDDTECPYNADEE